MILYFAYGSNMDPERIQEHNRVGRLPSAESAALSGYKLCFNKQADKRPGVGYANIVPSKGDIVHGILYELTRSELSKLDRCEGVHRGHYARLKVNVLLADEREVAAVAYIACPDKIMDGLLPEREYLDHLLAGKDYLPEAYWRALDNHAVAPLRSDEEAYGHG